LLILWLYLYDGSFFLLSPYAHLGIFFSTFFAEGINNLFSR
jgi:hypothetical protein